jgi:hypothetical protein|tara:strand:+ start:196 stop:468 length:273 start_codon:yes stop_codon:yes gene_type:complete
METKRTVQYEVRKGSVDLWSSSIRVADESGDVVEINYPSSAFREALKGYVVHSLSQSTQEELIELMTQSIRAREERQARFDAELAAEASK